MPLTLIFFVSALSLRQDCLCSEQTGVFLSETDSERFLDSDESVCCSLLQPELKMMYHGIYVYCKLAWIVGFESGGQDTF